MRRIQVIGECVPRCPSCVACRPGTPPKSADGLLEELAEIRGEVLLGGGDVTRWPPLYDVLARLPTRTDRLGVWLEAPAASLTDQVVSALASHGVVGVVVQIEARGAEMERALGVGNGEAAIGRVEAAGMQSQARLLVRPKTFAIVAPLARSLAPRVVWLEIVRRDWGRDPVTLPVGTLARLFESETNLRFSVQRLSETGYAPACALPTIWSARPEVFRATLGEVDAPNTTFPACASCTLAGRCRFRDGEGLADEDRERLLPVRDEVLPWERRRVARDPVPATITRRRDHREVICTTPWTTMEVVDPDGKVRQCCSTWTAGARGNVFEGSLEEIWNGEGYRAARRALADGELADLCLPICSRLHDQKYHERAFSIQRGTDAFVENQLLIAEDIAERREVTRAKPLQLSLCPSTYCNYDCIMCDHGRSPRRDLPEQIWEELPGLLPSLQTLTFLGGEPLAQPRMIKLLADLDAAKTPDLSIDFVTNGSLLSPKVLDRLRRSPIGDVTISLNAGTPEAYERVQRGIALSQVHANIDALIEMRRTHVRWFGITVSFVVQPAASAGLIEFAEFAHARDLRVRLMALNPEQHEGLDFYVDDDSVARVVADVDRLAEYCRRIRPQWLEEIGAVRAALLGEAAQRRRGVPPAVNARRLPVVP